MNCNFQSMKENLILKILYMEKQKIGHSIGNYIRFNSPEYYRHFEQLYLENIEIFIHAICDLKDVSDIKHQSSITDKNDEIQTYSGRILVHILRLRLYFGIHVSEIPELLKKLFIYSFKLQKDPDCILSRNGFWLNSECSDLLESISVDSGSPQKQLLYHNTSLNSMSFEHFITLQEVTDVYSANLYKQCYRYKYVPVYPTYIRQALKAAYLRDHLVTPSGWKEYFYKHSSNSIQNDLTLLRFIGFEKISSIMEEILNTMASKIFVTSKEKLRFCDRLVSRFHNKIQQCIKDETLTVINQFLVDRIE